MTNKSDQGKTLKRLKLSDFVPLLIGMGVASLTYVLIGWWGFWVIFPWVGGALLIN